jgi:hypothetical protein
MRAVLDELESERINEAAFVIGEKCRQEAKSRTA